MLSGRILTEIVLLILPEEYREFTHILKIDY